MDANSFRTATEQVPPRSMGINIDEGYLGVGMTLNVTGGPNLQFVGPERQVYRNWHWKDVMTLVRSAHTFKFGYEGQYVNFDLIRGNGARKFEPSLLAEGKIGRQFIALVGEVEEFESAVDLGARMARSAKPPAQEIFLPGLLARVLRGPQVLPDGELAEQANVLEGAGDAACDTRMRRQIGNVVAAEQHATVGQRKQPAD